MFRVVGLWIGTALLWVANRAMGFIHWIHRRFLPRGWWGLLTAYTIWFGLSAIALLGLGTLLGVPMIGFIAWAIFAVFAPLMIFSWARSIAMSLFAIAVVTLILRMTGIAMPYVGAFTALIVAIVFLRYLPVPLWVRGMIGGLLVAGLIAVLLLGGLDRLVPTFRSALWLAKFRGEQQSANLVGGSELFDPKTGLPKAKINPRTGEIFIGERVAYQFDPRTGEALLALTREKLIELCQREKGAPGMLARLCEQLGVIEPKKSAKPAEEQRAGTRNAERVPAIPLPPGLRLPPPIFPGGEAPAPAPAPLPQPPVSQWNWEESFPGPGVYTTGFELLPAMAWEFLAEGATIEVSGSAGDRWHRVPQGLSGSCGLGPWRWGPGDRILRVRTTGQAKLSLRLCR